MNCPLMRVLIIINGQRIIVPETIQSQAYSTQKIHAGHSNKLPSNKLASTCSTRASNTTKANPQNHIIIPHDIPQRPWQTGDRHSTTTTPSTRCNSSGLYSKCLKSQLAVHKCHCRTPHEADLQWTRHTHNSDQRQWPTLRHVVTNIANLLATRPCDMHQAPDIHKAMALLNEPASRLSRLHWKKPNSMTWTWI